MKTPQHAKPDRLKIAQVTGALTNLRGKILRGELTQGQAVADLHTITTDRHLLSHGLAGMTHIPGIVALAEAAGASATEAEAIHAEMHPADRRGMRLGRDG